MRVAGPPAIAPICERERIASGCARTGRSPLTRSRDIRAANRARSRGPDFRGADVRPARNRSRTDRAVCLLDPGRAGTRRRAACSVINATPSETSYFESIALILEIGAQLDAQTGKDILSELNVLIAQARQLQAHRDNLIFGPSYREPPMKRHDGRSSRASSCSKPAVRWRKLFSPAWSASKPSRK